MSYARFSEAQVYVFSTDTRDGQAFTCCACELGPDPFLKTRSEMIAHLEEHETCGHNTGDAITLLKEELADHGETEFRMGDG